MATDIVAGIGTQLATILTADAAFYGPSGLVKTVVRYDGDDPNPGMGNVQGGELPELEIDYEGGEETGYGAMTGYGYTESATPANLAWTETGVHNFVMTFTLEDVRITTANAVVNYAKRLVRAAGPTLGLSYVNQWGPLNRADEIQEAGDSARGHRCRVIALRLTVETILQGRPELS